jgi:hypothetical protein
VQLAGSRARDLPAPIDLARRAVEADGEELFVVDRRQINAIAHQNRRGKAGWQSGLLDQVLAGAEFDRKVPVIGDAGGVRTPELQPVLAKQRGDTQQYDGARSEYFH